MNKPHKIISLSVMIYFLSACAAPTPTVIPIEPSQPALTSIPATSPPESPVPTATDIPASTIAATETPEPLADPYNSPSGESAWTNIEPAGVEGQTFLMGDNAITSIEVGLITAHAGNGGDQLTLWVQDSAGEYLAIAYAAVDDGFNGWLRFDIEPSIEAEAGSILTVYLKDTGRITFGWKYAGNTYADGIAIMGSSEAPEFDFFFRVNPEP